MSLLPIHIAAGLIGVVSGFVALYSLKGAALHRKSGRVFVYAMVVMATTAVVMATALGERFNASQGALTFYLITTALLTVRRQAPIPQWINAALVVLALLVAAYDVTLGLEALARPRRTIDGSPAALVFVFGTVALLGALGDLRILRSGPLTGRRRIARHLWRMCFATFVASGSFFLGQAQVFPEPIRIVPLLAIPALLPLVLLVYWLWRVRTRSWASAQSSRGLTASHST